MDRVKFLLICLGVISLSAVALSGWIYFSSRTEVLEYKKKQVELERQNNYIRKKLYARKKEARHWRDKFEAISTTLDKLGKEYTLLQRQYDSLLKEKDTLAEKNKGLREQLDRLNKLYSKLQERMKLSASEEFLSSLLQEKAALEVDIERLKDKISSQQARLEDMRKQAMPIERLEEERKILEEKLTDARKVSDVLSKDLLQERKKRTALEEQLTQTEDQLKSVIMERDKLAEQLTKMRQALEQRLLELGRTKNILESAVEGAKKVIKEAEPPSIELPPIVVKAEPASGVVSETARKETSSLPEKLRKAKVEEAPGLEGRIINVNDRYKFVVIDIGRDSGVRKGMQFDVYREGKKIGKIEVIETRKNITACDIKEMSVRHLKINDIVRR